ncbi:MAG: LysR substrate-binding domain-containing protein [Gammaproteobacteria bacterium]|nr:LysR substrate-binding domain-containing protein [Gammaproteobacteria bacterium]
MDRLVAMTMFVRVVETGSFSAVAKEMNSTQPTISKNVAELESWLGAKLLNRSTRSLRLTETGADYYERCVSILQDVEAAEQVVGQLQTLPRGLVRISAMVGFGRLHVIPQLKDFFAQYPDIKVEVKLNDRVADLVEEGIDVAFRMGNLADSTLIAKRLCSSPTVTVATPEYLEMKGTPLHPRDLKDHEYIIYTDLLKSNDVTFTEDGKPLVIRVEGSLLTNNTEGLRTALISGLGISKAPKWLVGDLLKSGDLLSVLEDYQDDPVAVHAVYPSGRHLPSKVRCFIDYFADHFRCCDLIADQSNG